ncbi:MAG: efflux RND transporter periplasmic adaptor subunit [Kofleriaceae bacterium]|nr:efflux RND transporter periplasmic adaptor subunit [Kofleriaceae bacterium]
MPSSRAPQEDVPVHREWLLVVTSLAVATACGSEPASPAPAPPARVDAPVKESALTTVTLSEDAERRLGITTAKVEHKAMPRTRTYPARVEAVPGTGASIAAPVAGLLVAPSPLLPGRRVERGEVLLRLKPLVAAEADVLARGERDLAVAQARVEAARQRADRLVALAKDGASSQRSAEEATTDLAVAKADLAEVTARNARIRQNPFSSDVGLPLRAPDAGTVLRLSASPGQVVPAGAQLVELARVDRAWLRVAVYAGDLEIVARQQPATVTRPGSRDARAATPIEAPALADPTSATVELVYAIDNADASFLPGQRVLASLPLAGTAPVTVVPLAAVLYDIHGGAWVYTTGTPHTFQRRRIEIRDVVGSEVILERGPAPGTVVVTAGVAELYGTEFGSK